MGQKRTLEDFIKLANGTHNYVLVFFFVLLNFIRIFVPDLKVN